ncbi:MAG: Nuclear actin-protein involved in chromatin remodeling [Vezdaea aestivalis]|nr:MAG: Nuclear actin-protein involved in chromatin remodeling [Vezdaea aestivalis]
MPSATQQSPRLSPPPAPPKLYTVKEHAFNGPVPSFADQYSSTDQETAIVIDNGSGTLKAGWSSGSAPLLNLSPVMSRYTDRKWGRKFTFIGSEAAVDANARQQAKHAFGGGSGVVTNWDAMEGVLDYVFLKLGVDGEAMDGGIGRPVVMTEAVANLGMARKAMTEILFECYGAPSLTYGIDSLFSFRQNAGTTGLVISSSHTSTHLIPVYNQRPYLSQATRLNWGGSQSTDYLLKLLQLKYPTFPGKMTTHQATEMVREHCYVSQNYDHEASHYLDWTGLEDRDRVIQYPFTEAIVIEKSPEELARIAERKKEAGRRLQEQAAKQRLERLMRKEEDVEYYKDLQRRLADQTNKKEVRRLLEDAELRDEAHLDRTIKDLSAKIRKARMKDVDGAEAEEDAPAEEPSFPLLDTPDADLDEAGLKAKRHQRLLKSGYESRQRAKAEKVAATERKAAELAEDQRRREDDPEGWLQDRRTAYALLRQRLRDRARLKQDLGNRKSLASQLRMKSIANLASDNPAGGKKRRRGGGQDEDTFGANDDDWGVYRNIGTGEGGGGGGGEGAGAGSDEDSDAEDNAALDTLESELLAHDTSFTNADTLAAASDWRLSRLHAFLRGPWPFDADSARETHQVHLNVERIRVAEVAFRPSIAGVDQAGLVEIAADVLGQRVQGEDARERMAKDIFLTGGFSGLKGFEERVKMELRKELPVELDLRVRRAKDVVLDAWKGAAAWVREGDRWKVVRVTKAEYEEKGAEYFKEWEYGNAFAG